MRYWIREIAGWLLLLVGLAIFYVAITSILSPLHLYIGGSILTLIGFIVFRGGIHLLKVAVAARVCLQTQAVVRNAKPGPTPPPLPSQVRNYRPGQTGYEFF